jgi:hypothetical protein
MWAIGRRTALFIVSYVPLAAMFLALRWPSGWSADDLVLASVVVAGTATAAVGLFGVSFASGTVFTKLLLGAAVAGVGIVVLGLVSGWAHPLALHADKARTSAAAAGIAFGFVVAGLELLVVLLRNARRGSVDTWKVADARDQGGAVAGYLATYLLPLLNPNVHGARMTVAYAVYLFTLYVVFVRADGLVVINPMRYVFHYRMFDVRLLPPAGIEERRILLLSKVPIRGTMEVDVVPLGDECYVAKQVRLT